MTTYRFEEIKLSGSKKVPCDECGKQVSRTRTFTQTVNPLNKNDDGTMKTARQVSASVREEVRAWQAKQDGELCTPCYNAKWFPSGVA